jgi:hypothetical protein
MTGPSLITGSPPATTATWATFTISRRRSPDWAKASRPPATAAAGHAWQQAIHILDGMQHPDADHTRARLRQLNNSVNGQA